MSIYLSLIFFFLILWFDRLAVIVHSIDSALLKGQFRLSAEVLLISLLHVTCYMLHVCGNCRDWQFDDAKKHWVISGTLYKVISRFEPWSQTLSSAFAEADIQARNWHDKMALLKISICSAENHRHNSSWFSMNGNCICVKETL